MYAQRAAEMRAEMGQWTVTVAEMGQRGDRWGTILRTCRRLARKYATGMDPDGLLTDAEWAGLMLTCGAVLLSTASACHPDRPREGMWWD
jgi:hypothetical protein